ncbi:PREDICTED: putative glutathione-specific gamma-glutamylcyclotransferase 2 isoform X2 [Diuraphis noxia]|uniref:putative glutathione-specific gamma-glutamylcyclotransferase 2 isoform X2 n=1 Tax=Diuraphis noxia TaxID=143948 RepID=UPI000763A834|nr:PREDICTED: putative glutathione-specific gamma-glutamylcyclotransferase 2 isoform X2 [Diuraphis noxia]
MKPDKSENSHINDNDLSNELNSHMFWIFGYGSLIWKTNFPFVKKYPGYIKGYTRRFYQFSPDHRGTNDLSRVWGIAYGIDNRDIDNVCAGLDLRERAGYTKKVIQFHTKTNEDQIPSEVIVYIADENNEWFAGEAPIQQIASRIAICRGTSGSNPEYVHKLAAEMRRIAPEEDDKHLFELEMALKSIENSL